MSAADDRPLPHDDDVERVILAAPVLNNDALAEVAALEPDLFYSNRHRAVLRALKDLHADGVPAELVLLNARLNDSGKLSDAGGPAYLATILQGQARGIHLPHYTAKLRELAWKRELVRGSEAIQQAAVNGKGTDAVAELVTKMTTRWAETKPAAASPMKSLDLAELVKTELDPVPWVVPGWLADGDAVVLAGDGGIGKTWIGLDLAFALATGGEFLSSIQVQGEPRRVLVVDEENSHRLVRYRARKIINRLGVKPAELDKYLAKLPLRYLSENALNLDDSGKLQALFREVESFKPSWVIFDSLVRLHRRDENVNADMARFFAECIQPLRVEYGAGVVMHHHLAKPPAQGNRSVGYRMRGASEIRNYPDQCWGLEKEDGGLVLKHIKCRWAEEADPLAITMTDSQDGNAIFIIAEAAASKTERTVDDMLERAETAGVLRTEIVKALEADDVQAAARAATRILGRMHAMSRVKKRREGNPTRYWKTDYAPGDAS